MTKEFDESTDLTERLNALLLASGTPMTNAVGRPPSMWIVDADPAGRAASLLRRSLAFLGMSNTREIAVDALDSIHLEDREAVSPFVVLLSFTGEPTGLNNLVEDWCGKVSVPWTRVVFDSSEGYVDTGPIFQTGRTPCYSCFAELHLQECRRTAEKLPHFSTIAFWCNMLAPSLLALYKQSQTPYMTNGFNRFKLPSLQHSYLRRAFLPHCLCHELTRGAERSQQEEPVSVCGNYAALIYEDYVGRERPHQASSLAANNFISKSLVLKLFPNSAKIALAEPSPLTSIGIAELLDIEPSPHLQPLTLKDLTAILFYSLGLRFVDISRSTANRWAASAGNLGSPELFVFANEVRGVAPGLYHYRALAHDLVSLQFRRTFPWDDYLSSLVEGEALLCFTGSFHRLQQKYGAFGYRLVHLDAGVAFSQASLIARSLNVSLTLVKEIDEQCLTRCLNLPQVREQLTAVARISAAPSVPSPKQRHLRHASQIPIGNSIKHTVNDAAQPSTRRLEEILYLESMRTAPASTPRRGRLGREGSLAGINEIGTSFKEDAGNDLKLIDVLMRRGSVRRFDRKKLPHAALAAIIRVAHEADCDEWQEEYLRGKALQFFLLENNIDDQKALYEFQPIDGSLSLIKAIPGLNNAPSLYVDVCFQNAPAAIWIVGDLAEAIRTYGSYGHRQLLFRAGAAANRLWLTALSLGIAGTISAGLLPRIARQLLDFDGWKTVALCAFVAGVPADDVLR
jgi:SagB-type dehydrogenase family enzyme